MFTKKKLHHIVAGFQKTINDLNTLVAENEKDIGNKSKQIETLQGELRAVDNENISALSIIKNFETLLALKS